MKSLHLLFLAAVIAFQTLSLATVEAQEIGQGYTCTDKKIFKKNKEVKLSKAKQSIQAKIDAVQGNSAKAKAKKSALKTVKSNLTACTNGTLGGGGTGGGTELTGNIDELESSQSTTGSFVGGYTVDGVKHYLQMKIESVGTIRISALIKADGILTNDDFQGFTFRVEYHTPLPAVTLSNGTSDFENTTKYGNVTVSTRKFKGKRYDDYQIEIKNDFTPLANRVRADIASFNFTMRSKDNQTPKDFYASFTLEGTFTGYNDAGAVVVSGPILVTEAD